MREALGSTSARSNKSPIIMPRFVSDHYREEIRRDYLALLGKMRSEMDETGMAVLRDIIHPDFLAELRTTVDQLLPLCYEGGKRKSMIGSDLKNTGFSEMAYSEFMVKLGNDLLNPFNIQLEAADIHPALSILIGKQGQDTLKGWHFDATYLSVAMPVVMPPPGGDRDGKFRIWPNVRQFSQSPWKNRVYWNLAKVDLLRRMVKNYAINFIPGNLYFFYGFRSYHGPDELDESQLRANCLINYGGPFFDLEKGKVVKYKKPSY